MNIRPTPETDKFFATFADGEAAPSHAEYYARLQDLERERDEARFDLDFRRRLGDWQNKTIDDLTKQRDRLAVALLNIVSIYEKPAKGCIPCSSDMYDEALQSLTTKEEP